MSLETGAMLERYEIVRLVGRGGMGEVYHAIDTRLRRPVALKVLRADKDQSYETGNAGVARLMREAQAAASLNHPNSVAIYELGEAPLNGNAVHFIAMELIEGESFRKHTNNTNVSIETKVGWLIDAARALHAAHKVGIVHRDIKPANIMVSQEGTVKVLDFGLAKPAEIQATTRNPHSFQTKFGQVLGTPRYMAPEQIEGLVPDGRTDQFAFGLTAYELLTGEYAGGPLVVDIMPAEHMSPLVCPGLSRVIMKTLTFDKEGRYASMDDVASALKAVLPEVKRFAVETTTKLPNRDDFADVTEKHRGFPVNPSVMPTRSQTGKEIGTMRMQTPPQGLPPIPGVTNTSPMPVRAPLEKNATVALARPVTPMPMPIHGPSGSHSPSVPNPPPSQPMMQQHSASYVPGVRSSQSVRSSQALSVSGSVPFPIPAQPRSSNTNIIWIVAGLVVATFAVIAGGILALFLR